MAESFEAAQEAADLVRIQYEAETPTCSFRENLGEAHEPASHLVELIVVAVGDPCRMTRGRALYRTAVALRAAREAQTGSVVRIAR
ncbi:hypothetical protein [Tunturiibacter psychrotolerans]|uniref:hypothetical protein n=1 Tax=Tunturiibacter psychrotolerans TaxID=3069686 RepID=UPI003D19F43F